MSMPTLKHENIKAREHLFLSFLTIFLVGYVLLTTPCTVAFAQSSNTIGITLSPERPRAFQDIEVSIESFALDLQTSSISWTINSKPIEQGLGKTKITFKTGALGSYNRIRAVVTSTHRAPY